MISRHSPTDALARFSLAHLPTRIEPMPRLSQQLGGPEMWIKRDDQTGLALGGNKTRKLEFIIADALQQGADCVITAGAVQSNHARQTAAAARRAGLEPHLVLNGSAPQVSQGNLLLDNLLKATIHWTAEHAPYTQTIDDVFAELQAGGRKPYVVPYGGSNALGVMGYVSAMSELAEQIRGGDAPSFDVQVFATSSGATQAGMIVGAHLAGIKSRLVGISVDMEKRAFAPNIVTLANSGASLLGLDWRIDADDVEINDQYLGAGYAVVGEGEREAIKMLAQLEGILVDPVYTGRAMAGLIDLIRRGEIGADQKVLFWHTGGTPALFAFAEVLRG